MNQIDNCPTDVSDIPFDPFSPDRAQGIGTQPVTGNPNGWRKPEVDEKGNLSQSLPQGIWERNVPPNVNQPRIKPKQPRTAGELSEAIEAEAQTLTEELSWFEANKGSNPQQEKIVRLKLEIAKLQERLNPLLADLAEAQAEPTPSERIVKRLAEITISIQGLARESTERKLIQLAKQKFDVSDLKALDKNTVKNLIASDTIKSIRDLTLPFWSRFSKLPRLEDLQDAADRAFTAANQLLNFLK
jgi:hypothetical protein